ncbi:UNC-like C-terminal-domain-containing protein [Ochromonadaceae sp. CCMP2298]|nr:UNC-like C-terminal-domain-containing protein [Ochromonadaceae sp. CCMP2298]|mmetsp:Transcript_10959/g.24309  ORF Transcript_10959/g.24309 Transcript_10959/m.24309 type:complete len:504 (+) Transcript_10959:83-1594(+)
MSSLPTPRATALFLVVAIFFTYSLVPILRGNRLHEPSYLDLDSEGSGLIVNGLAKRQAETSNIRAAIQQLQTSIQTFQAPSYTLSSELTSQLEEIQKMKGELSDKINRFNTTNAAMAASVDQLSAQNAARGAQRAELINRAEGLSAEVRALSDLLSSSQVQKGHLLAMKQESTGLSSEVSALGQRMGDSLHGIAASVADLRAQAQASLKCPSPLGLEACPVSVSVAAGGDMWDQKASEGWVDAAVQKEVGLLKDAFIQDLSKISASCLANLTKASADATAAAEIACDLEVGRQVALVTEELSAQITPPTAETKSIPLDFALVGAGASVISSKTSATYFPQQWRVEGVMKGAMDFVGFDAASAYDMLNLGSAVGTPEKALVADTHLGACWPMQGSSGNLTVLLGGGVRLSSFTIDHVSSKQAKDLRSAPKDFEVYGLRLEQEEEILLSKGTYRIDSEDPVQTFPVLRAQMDKAPLRAVTLRVLSNHGHEGFTCLYRFRVHGAAQ